MKACLIIDGPNFVSRLIGLGIDTENIADNLSLNTIYIQLVRGVLRHEFGTVLLSPGIEFFCSSKRPGPKGNKITEAQWRRLQARLANENAVTLNKILLSSQNEKGVDIAVATRMIELSEICDIICLASSDKDFVPVIEYLKRKGKYIITIGIEESHPSELRNLSYLYIDMEEYLRGSFIIQS